MRYNQDTGEFFWRAGWGGVTNISERAGMIATFRDGRKARVIGLGYHNHMAGQLAWIYVHGALNKKYVVHKNGNTLDDRIENLAAVSPSQLGGMMKKPKTNTSGFKGVSWARSRQRWEAYIKVDRRRRTLGRFRNVLDAARAYDKAALAAWGELAMTNMKEGNFDKFTGPLDEG